MTTRNPNFSPVPYARVAGLLYLVIAAFGAFAIAYVPSVIVVGGDASATAANLIANKGLFGLGTLADFVVMLAEIAITVLLYILLRSVNPALALVAMIARLLMVVVMATNVLINIATLVLVGGADYLGVFPPAQLEATVLLLTEVHGYGVFIWDVFFGFHLSLLGYLVLRSGFLPRLLGAGLLIGSFGYMLEGLQQVTFLESELAAAISVGLLILASVSEVAFGLWLLIRGLNRDAWSRAQTALAAA